MCGGAGSVSKMIMAMVAKGEELRGKSEPPSLYCTRHSCSKVTNYLAMDADLYMPTSTGSTSQPGSIAHHSHDFTSGTERERLALLQPIDDRRQTAFC